MNQRIEPMAAVSEDETGSTVAPSGDHVDEAARTVSKTSSAPPVVQAAPLLSFLQSTEAQLMLGVLALAAVFAVRYPDSFATRSNALNMATVAGILLVVSIGQAVVLIIGGFDISVAANMSFVSVVAALVMAQGWGVATGALMGVVAATLVGLVNGVVIARLAVSPFIATLAMLTFLTGLGEELSHGGSVEVVPTDFAVLGGGDWGPIPSAVGIAAMVTVVAWLLLARTRFGLYVYAIGGSRETARVAGIPVIRYQVAAYTVCGLFAGISGVMLASRVSVGQATLAQGYELLSIAAAAIGGVAIGGGVGRLSGVGLGVALLVILTTGLDIAGLNTFIQEMVTGVVLVIAVLVARARGVSWLSASWRKKSHLGSTGNQ